MIYWGFAENVKGCSLLDHGQGLLCFGRVESVASTLQSETTFTVPSPARSRTATASVWRPKAKRATIYVQRLPAWLLAGDVGMPDPVSESLLLQQKIPASKRGSAYELLQIVLMGRATGLLMGYPHSNIMHTPNGIWLVGR